MQIILLILLIIVEDFLRMAEEQKITFKLFDRYDVSEVLISDEGMKEVINISPHLSLKSYGRNVGKGSAMKVNVVERLMNKLAVAGHRGKKHKIEFGRSTGKYTTNMGTILKVLDMLEKSTGKNPIQVLVTAIEHAAPRDETTVIEYGGARYPQAVDVSPTRRLNVALRNLVHGGSDRAFNKKKTIVQGLAEEIKLAYESNGESAALKKKNEIEKQADSAR